MNMKNIKIMRYKKKTNKKEKSKYFDWFDMNNIFRLACVAATVTLTSKAIYLILSLNHFVIDDIMEETGCHPSHWIQPTSLPLCTNATGMKNFSLQPTTLKVEMYDPPCKIIERLDYTYKEKDDPREFSR